MHNLKNTKIGIVGLGLLGGSLALKLMDCQLQVYGFVRNLSDFKIQQKLSTSVQQSFAKLTDDLKQLAECDVVFLCTPLRDLVSTAKNIQQYLKPGTLLTDIGSVKETIVEKISGIMRADCFFIGAHPMAGTEKSGFANALVELFEGRSWAVMENPHQEQTKLLLDLIILTGAKPLICRPKEHDKAVALISHLPLLLSMALKKTVDSCQDLNVKELAFKLASSGYEGMTRLANGNPTLNADLLSLNSSNLKTAVACFEELVGDLTDDFTYTQSLKES